MRHIAASLALTIIGSAVGNSTVKPNYSFHQGVLIVSIPQAYIGTKAYIAYIIGTRHILHILLAQGIYY